MSRILGLVRDMALAATFGGGPVLDAFIVAFRLPNLARQLLGEGALSTAFLPVFLRDLEQNGPVAARRTLTSVFWWTAWILLGLLCAGELGLLLLQGWIPAESESQLVLRYLVQLFPYMVLICLAALLSAALNALREFFWPGIIPIVLNLVWLAGLGFAVMWTTEETARAHWMCLAIVFAGGLQMALPLLVLARRGWGIGRPDHAVSSQVREVYSAVLPVVAGIGLTQIGAVFDSVIAWGLAIPQPGHTAPCELLGIQPVLESGTASALYLGQRLYQFPLGVFGVALGTVLFPVLAQHAARNDLESLRADLTRGLRLVVAIAIPASVGLMQLAPAVTRLLFQHGRFDTGDSQLTTRFIAIYGSGVWLFIGLLIVNRAFYAVGDRQTPLRLGLSALVLNLLFNLSLVWHWGGAALACGGVLAAAWQLSLSVWGLQSRVGRLDWTPVAQTGIKVLIATTCMAFVVWGCGAVLPADGSLSARALQLLAPMLAGGGTYLGLSFVLGIQEVAELFRPERKELTETETVE